MGKYKNRNYEDIDGLFEDSDAFSEDIFLRTKLYWFGVLSSSFPKKKKSQLLNNNFLKIKDSVCFSSSKCKGFFKITKYNCVKPEIEEYRFLNILDLFSLENIEEKVVSSGLLSQINEIIESGIINLDLNSFEIESNRVIGFQGDSKYGTILFFNSNDGLEPYKELKSLYKVINNMSRYKNGLIKENSSWNFEKKIEQIYQSLLNKLNESVDYSDLVERTFLEKDHFIFYGPELSKTLYEFKDIVLNSESYIKMMQEKREYIFLSSEFKELQDSFYNKTDAGRKEYYEVRRRVGFR